MESAIQYLTDAFPEKNKNIRKISIPMLIYLADVAENAEIKPRFFRDWWGFFIEEDKLMEVYKTFCSSGSTKLEKIKGRLAIMTKSFCLYHELEVPEELKDMVREVEEKLALKEESEKAALLNDAETLLEENAEASQEVDEKEVILQDTENVEDIEDVNVTSEEYAEETACDNSIYENSNEEDNSSDFENAEG